MAAAKKAAKKATKKAAKKTTKKTAKKAAAAPSLLTASRVREAIRGHGMRMDSTFIEALNDEVSEVIAKAAKRAEDNKRSTVRPSDL